jgi:hypothetical protein
MILEKRKTFAPSGSRSADFVILISLAIPFGFGQYLFKLGN